MIYLVIFCIIEAVIISWLIFQNIKLIDINESLKEKLFIRRLRNK